MARARRTLDQYLEDPHPDLAYVRLRVGERRNPETVGWLALSEHADAARKRTKDSDHALIIVRDVSELRDQVLDLADGAGWPDELPTCKLHAFNAAGQELPGWQRTVKNPIPTATAGADPMAVLVDGMVRMADRQGRALEALGAALQHREEVMADTIEAMLETHAQRQEVEAELVHTQVENLVTREIADATAEELDPSVKGLLGQIGAFLGGQLGGGIDLEDIDPDSISDEQLDALVSNEQLVGRVLSRWRRRQAEGANDGE